MNNEAIVSSIKQLCKDNNITVTQLEKEVGMSQGLVSKWKDKVPSLDKIIDIADYFHVTLDEVVGRNNLINDEFLKVLYDKTTNKKICWKIFNLSEDESGLKQYHEHIDFDFFSEEEYNNYYETHKEISYYFEFMSGYISIYAMYGYYNITNPYKIKMFIQPDIKAELIPQCYDLKELLPLWIKILTSLNSDAPDEIKAEELKNDFVKSFKHNDFPDTNFIKEHKIHSITFKNDNTSNAINYLLKIQGCIMYDLKNNEIISQKTNLKNDDTAVNFYWNNKNKLGKVIQIKLINGKDIFFISNNKIMKLSGFSWGSKSKDIAYGLEDIICSSGFIFPKEKILTEDDITLSLN